MRTLAYILHAQKMGEYDQLITLFTRQSGKVDAIAKSSLKPSSIQGMHLHPMSRIECDLIEGRSYPIIAGAQEDRACRFLKSNIYATAIALHVMEALQRMTSPYQHDEHIWHFLERTWDILDVAGTNRLHARDILEKTQADLLSVLGYYPNLGECVSCGHAGSSFDAFSPQLMGVMCGGCFLAGHHGILIHNKQQSMSDIFGSICESITGSAFYSLPLVKAVLQYQ